LSRSRWPLPPTLRTPEIGGRACAAQWSIAVDPIVLLLIIVLLVVLFGGGGYYYRGRW
jgi:hypothetical protein